MKLPCEIIQDLLPLYADGVCGEASRAAVEEHLEECPACREQLRQLQKFAEEEFPVPAVAEGWAVAKSFRKIRRRWAASLAAVLLVIPILLLTVNQVRKEGVCYTNLDEIVIAGQFMKALKNQDWEKAADRLDYEKQYEEIQELMGMTAEDFLPRFTPVVIGGEQWMAKDSFFENYPQYAGDEILFWKEAVFSRAHPFIPFEAWEKLKAETPELFQEDSGSGLVATNDFGEIEYIQIGTQWGTFMVSRSSGLSECKSAAELCGGLDFVPVKLYEAAAPDLAREAGEQYDFLQERYAPVANLSLEEFCAARKQAYIQGLAECAQKGFEFGDYKYEGSEVVYVDNIGCWQVTYRGDVAYQGKSYVIHLSQNVSDGEIADITASVPDDLPDGNALCDALNVQLWG